jgi:hypothetical protein
MKLMNRSTLRTTAIAVLAILSLAGCGGGAANANEPAGAVSAALDAAESGGFAKVLDFTCAAKKNDVAGLFGGAGGLGSLGALGVDPNSILDAMKMDFQDVKTTEKSKSGNNATVHVTGKMVMTFDATKMKAVMKQILAAQGQPADDAMVDAALAGMSSQLTQTQTLDEDIDVVNEGGKWLICD